jgi:RNA-binding protein YhbY
VDIDEKSCGNDRKKELKKKNQNKRQNEESNLPSKDDIARIWADEKPAVRIGKEGLDAGIIEEVKRQLKRQKVIKVKFLRSMSISKNINELTAELAAKTSSEVWGRRGFVVVLARR